MTNYIVLSKQSLTDFPFQQSPKPIVPVEPDLLLEMTFSPKLFIISDIASKVEELVVHGVEWLDARGIVLQASRLMMKLKFTKIIVCLTSIKLIN